MADNCILSLKGITKTFPGVVALNDVSLSFRQGEVHALLGENGAGKSTLIKTVSGALTPDTGVIEIDGHRYEHMTPALSKKCGIEVIYQEFNLVEPLSVAENMFLGEPTGKTFNLKSYYAKAQKIFDEWGIDLDPAAEVMRLSPGKKQLVEISKCLCHDIRILVLDEPTAPLSTTEVEILYRIIEKLKATGVTVIYISHRMEEIFRITDRVSILRDGEYVATEETAATDRKRLISLMVGRELKESYPARDKAPGEEAFRVEHLCGNGDRDISFTIRRGEIYGLAGLVGAGRTELAQVIFGLMPKESGKIFINGKEVQIHSAGKAIHEGMGLIPEDRKFLGCLQELSIAFNISLSALKRICSGLLINRKKETELVDTYSQRLAIKAPSMKQEVKNLSGGNQQKVVLAKALAANPEILIFDEPTRGIDVGAKQEIYQLMNELAQQGHAILMISSELEELMGMSDRIGVIYEGCFAGELAHSEFDQKLIIGLASDMKREEIV
jgi:ribose transport system ATP-binding protein